jgi:hypothetical protein
MKLLFLIQVLVMVAIVTVGCSERKKSETETPSKEHHTAGESISGKEQHIPMRTIAQKSNGLDDKQQYLEFLNEMKSRPDPVVFLESRWSEIWEPTFDVRWSPSDMKTLSQLINDLESGSETSFNQIVKERKEPWAKDLESRKSAITIAAACAAIFSTPPADDIVPAAELPRLFNKYRDQMPPTAGDVMICKMIAETSALFEGRPQIPEGRAEAWNELASAKNPLYRLIALKIFRSFQVSQKQAETFYSMYLNETEEGINKALVNALSTRNDPWAAETVVKVQEKIRPN